MSTESNAADTTARRFKFIVDLIFYLAAAALFYVALKYLLPLLLPFVIAFCIAAALQKPIALLCARFARLPRKLTAAIVTVTALATVGTAAALIIGALFEELSEFFAEIPGFLSRLAKSLSSGSSPIDSFIAGLPDGLRSIASDLYESLGGDLTGLLVSAAEGISGILPGTVGAIGSLAMRLPSAVISVLICLISVFFIGLDYPAAKAAIAEAVPQRLKARLLHIKSCSADTLLCLLKTYAFLMLLTFTELAVAFALFNLLGAGIPYPVPLALLTALVDILPVLGVGTVLLPWAAFDLIAGNYSRAVMLLVLYGTVIIVRNLLEPKLIGQRFGLHPVLTLLAIYVGGKLFGFIGVFLLPLTAIVLRRLTDSRPREGGTKEAERT